MPEDVELTEWAQTAACVLESVAESGLIGGTIVAASVDALVDRAKELGFYGSRVNQGAD